MTARETGQAPEKPEEPLFVVTRGDPDAVQLGVLAAVFATARGNAENAGPDRSGIRDDWGSYDDRLRSPFGYSPGSFLNSRQY